MDFSDIYGCSKYGNVDELNNLIAEGADINESDDDGNTTLHHCSFHSEIVNFLLATGAEVNKTNIDGDTPSALCQ